MHPLCLWRIIHNSRDSVAKMIKTTLLNMLELIYGKGNNQGEIKHNHFHLKRKIRKQIKCIGMLKSLFLFIVFLF